MSHFYPTGERTEFQRGYIMCPGAHSWDVVVGTQVWPSLAGEVVPGERGRDLWDVVGTQERGAKS